MAARASCTARASAPAALSIAICATTTPAHGSPTRRPRRFPKEHHAEISRRASSKRVKPVEAARPATVEDLL
jgi:hypothetical protein